MRKITKKIIHCSDSDIPAHDDISVIDSWHKAKGWAGVGYHFFIKRSGKLQYGRPLAQQGAHTAGYNQDSIGICLHGKKKFRKAQFTTLRALCEALDLVIGNTPEHGHNEFTTGKTCPNFNVKEAIK